MKNADLHVSDTPVRDLPATDRSHAAYRLASEIKSQWDDGARADTRAVLGDHPHLLAHKSIVLDLAYEEYCQRVELGEPIEPAEFCQQFPSHRKSLLRLIEIHRYLEQNPQLAPEGCIGQWPQVGETFLGFCLLEELGRGAFARVFLAAEPALGHRQVAIKIARHGAAEAETLGRLEHPNIVPVNSLQVDEASGLSAICMPYLGKSTLCDVLAYAFNNSEMPTSSAVVLDALRPTEEVSVRRTRPLLRSSSYAEAALQIAIQLADALVYAHSRGITHCDLKPSNILMTPGGRPMLLDFNLCRDERHTTRESWGGTVPYMSPEQLKSMCPGEPHRLAAIGARSDIFSLGVILYELLCGSLPFGPIPWESTWEKMRDELLDRQRVGPRPMPHAAQVDPELIGLLRRCLAFDANDRPASAQAFADALRQYLSPSCRARRWVRARRRPMLAGACALLAVLGASGYALAVRDPYSVRQLQRGISYYRQDNFREAIKCLSRAVDADANLAPALFMRGRAHQQLGALNLALADYVAADGLVRDGPTLACIGYCSTLLTLHDSAIWNFKKAIEAGFDRAEVYNDLGYIYARMDKYEDARRCFDQAVARGPKLQTAYYNRAMFEFQWALEESNPIPETVIPDIQTAISLGPVTAQLLCDAARIYAVAARSDRDWIEPALRYLERSIELGQDPRPLVEDRSFFALRELPEFIACLEHPAVPSSAPRPVRVLDPVTRFAD